MKLVLSAVSAALGAAICLSGLAIAKPYAKAHKSFVIEAGASGSKAVGCGNGNVALSGGYRIEEIDGPVACFRVLGNKQANLVIMPDGTMAEGWEIYFSNNHGANCNSVKLTVYALCETNP